MSPTLADLAAARDLPPAGKVLCIVGELMVLRVLHGRAPACPQCQGRESDNLKRSDDFRALRRCICGFTWWQQPIGFEVMRAGDPESRIIPAIR